MRRVNNGYYETAYRLAYDIENNVFEPTPQRFRCKSKGDIKNHEQNNEVITNWIETAGDRVLITDSDMAFKPKDKILFSLEKNDLNEYVNGAEITEVTVMTDPNLQLSEIRNRNYNITEITLER